MISSYGFDVDTSGYDDEDRRVSWQPDNSNLDQAWDLSLVGDWNRGPENTSTQTFHLRGGVVASRCLRTIKRVRANQVGEASLMSERSSAPV